MVWLAVVIAAAAIALLLLIARSRRHGSPTDRAVDDVDPLFTSGIVLAGAGVALALTIGAFMYVMVIAGLSVMAIGASRTRHSRR